MEIISINKIIINSISDYFPCHIIWPDHGVIICCFNWYQSKNKQMSRQLGIAKKERNTKINAKKTAWYLLLALHKSQFYGQFWATTTDWFPKWKQTVGWFHWEFYFLYFLPKNKNCRMIWVEYFVYVLIRCDIKWFGKKIALQSKALVYLLFDPI